MKIYGTTESERASKGQGGNQFIKTVHTVEHKDGTREIVSTTAISINGDSYEVRHLPVVGDETVYTIPIRSKSPPG